MSPEERAIRASLDEIVQADAIRTGIGAIVERAQRKLTQDPAAVMAWEPIPSALYGESLPAFIRSS
jgi:hypothetical protein